MLTYWFFGWFYFRIRSFGNGIDVTFVFLIDSCLLLRFRRIYHSVIVHINWCAFIRWLSRRSIVMLIADAAAIELTIAIYWSALLSWRRPVCFGCQLQFGIVVLADREIYL